MSPEGHRPGGLVAVVGPSGAGKDTLLALAARSLAGDPRIHFARRTVTRVAQADAEDHDGLTPEAFALAKGAGRFSLTWNAHGLDYGLPAHLVARCAEGAVVVANLSRRALRPAASIFGRLEIAEIHAPIEILARRIAARGRETEAEIARRLERRAPMDLPAEACGLHRIDNSGDANVAAEALVRLLQSFLAAP